MDAAVLGQTLNLMWSVGVVALSASVAIVVARRRGLDKVEAESEAVAKQLRDDLMARVALLELANRDKDATIGAQNSTIATLTAKTASLSAKVEELEVALARERRITATMRGEMA